MPRSRYNGGNPPSGSAFAHGGNPQDRNASPQRAALHPTRILFCSLRTV